MLSFRGSKSNKSSYYHSEMNWDAFSHCLETVVFPVISATRQKSVVALDWATYRTALDDEDLRPVQSWNKSRLICSLKKGGGPLDDWVLTRGNKKTKYQLLYHARKIYSSPKYKIQEIEVKLEMEIFSIKILMSSVAHPDLNPIEIV